MKTASTMGKESPELAPRRRAYPLALFLVCVALVVSLVLLVWADVATLVPLVGAVAVAASYGGVGPSLAATAVGWSVAWFALMPPRYSLRMPATGEFLRWLIALGVALVVVWLTWLMRRTGTLATLRAEQAERSHSLTEAVQRLATELSSAVTPSDVAHVLVERMPGFLGSDGAALGLVDGHELRIVDPEGAPRQTLAPGLRLSLDTRAPITTAARTGDVVFASTREAFEREFPDGARLAPKAAGALAVPLVAGERVVGSMGFPFLDALAIEADTIAFARLAAELGGQALERSGLYEHERQTRESLERIARLAPLFRQESPESLVAAICEEARRTLGSDVAQIWTADDSVFDVLWRDPPSELVPPGTLVQASDFPGLMEALERLETIFLPDSPHDVKGVALEHALRLGIRSSLRIPVVIGGVAERVLVLQWERVIPDPSPSALALARRFADQAGLVLEQAERRVAQEAAARNAEETRRLLDLTSALAAALTPTEVASALLGQTFMGIGASAGVVVRTTGDGQLEVVDAEGYPRELLAGWGRFDLDVNLPLSDAVRRNEIVAIESSSERSRLYPELDRGDARHAAWLSIPLLAGGRVVGGVGLSFETPRVFSDADREFGFALSRQAGQALERATLLQTEHDARTRAERMASDLAQLQALATSLGRAIDAADVSELVGAQMIGGVGADTGGLYVLEPGGTELVLLDLSGRLDRDDLAGHERVVLGGTDPVAHAARTGRAVWLASDDEWESFPGASAWREDGIGVLGVVPLVIDQRAVGALLAIFENGAVVDDEQRRFVEIVARQAAQPLERLRLLEEERTSRVSAERANERIRGLQRVAESLAAAPATHDVGAVMIAEGRDLLGGEGSLAHILAPGSDRLELLGSSGYPADLLEPLRSLALDAPTPMTDALRTGATIEIGSADDLVARYPGFAPTLKAGPFPAALFLPLAVGERTIGVLTVAFLQNRDFTADDRVTGLTLARQCAQALERSRLYDEERVSRRRSERLQTLTAALSSALTPDEVSEIFLEQAAPAVDASGAAIGIAAPDGHPLGQRVARGDAAEAASAWFGSPAGARSPALDAFRGARPLYFESLDDLRVAYPDTAAESSDSRAQAFAFVPLLAGRKPFGVTMLTWDRPTVLTAGERSFVETLASQCAQALDRARRYENERVIAETLQRSVLPETLPSLEGVVVAARYLPGTAAVDVGGDWFDTIPLSNGKLGFAVGDVVGKGVQAASTMAQLRNGMRALALDSTDPDEIVTKLNRLLDGVADAPFATLVYLTIDPVSFETTMVSAGHLPPLAVTPGGDVRLLEEGRGLPLGVDPDARYQGSSFTLEPGTIVVLYTDGLVERRDRSLDEGLRLLAEAARDAPRDAERMVDAILERLLGDDPRGDDVAVLAICLDLAPLGSLDLRLPSELESLVELRSALGAWLERGGIPEVDARDILLAAWEAGANAVEHALEPREPVIRLEADLTGDRVMVEVSDTGGWREPDPRADRGLGLRLIQSLMTTVNVQSGEEGTRLAMERVLTRERVNDDGAATAHD